MKKEIKTRVNYENPETGKKEIGILSKGKIKNASGREYPKDICENVRVFKEKKKNKK